MVRLLIVDDDFISRQLLSTILKDYGECDVAVSGDEAVLAYKLSIKEGKPYDGIFLDIMMPGSDGYSALEGIRSWEEERGVAAADRVKVIMATAVDDPKMMMRAFRSQCDSYVVKPIVESKVLSAAEKAGLFLFK
ncbi:MAG: response regulator [Spirochaetales bacterium]|nr:response regulator [Spirochaetales bacterium]